MVGSRRYVGGFAFCVLRFALCLVLADGGRSKSKGKTQSAKRKSKTPTELPMMSLSCVHRGECRLPPALPHQPRGSTVNGQRSKVGCGAYPTYDLPHTTYVLSFQQHSGFQSVTTFVFYNIPATLSILEARSFVFNNIPASVVHF